MENTHGGPIIKEITSQKPRLNPYYNGKYSWRAIQKLNGIIPHYVLILIIMENTHGELPMVVANKRPLVVLILIIMENTHGGPTLNLSHLG